MTRTLLGVKDALDLINKKVVEVSFEEGETEDEDFCVLKFSNGMTLYASAPSLYGDSGAA